ncbi:hypothetical protein [Zunongwangia sp. HRR-M8]|uniref:hypothetical protein n=1 Tax=Zunongwangia sp. HRR-M8 TaxID=3015170 RepID=UPI0022DD26A5|nr:hypothetical protein [Zunongwangia sp. HRR-M8]WBL22962.1 hypothetical protein PBT89_03150 [Zunongwangia sp. HRR-M8]
MKKVSREIALNELVEFVKIHKPKEVRRGQLTPEKIEDDFLDILEAIEDGNLMFKDEKPVYSLLEPVKNQDDEVILETINFEHTRIKPSQLANLSKGLDISKNAFEFGLRCTAYIIGEPKTFLDKLSTTDFKVVQGLASLFM